MPQYCFCPCCPVWSRLIAPHWFIVCVCVCVWAGSLFVVFPCVTLSHQCACYCHGDYAVTYACFSAPWLTGLLPRWSPEEVGTDHTSSSSFLWMTVSPLLSSPVGFFRKNLPIPTCWTKTDKKRWSKQNKLWKETNDSIMFALPCFQKLQLSCVSVCVR